MKDDSLNDTQRGADKMYCDCHNSTAWKPGWHTSDCWQRQYQAKAKPDSVEFKAKLPITNFNTEAIKEGLAELSRYKLSLYKLDSVGITDERSVVVKQNEKEHNKIWNAAIEAAAKEYEENTPGNINIRKLKK